MIKTIMINDPKEKSPAPEAILEPGEIETIDEDFDLDDFTGSDYDQEMYDEDTQDFEFFCLSGKISSGTSEGI